MLSHSLHSALFTQLLYNSFNKSWSTSFSATLTSDLVTRYHAKFILSNSYSVFCKYVSVSLRNPEIYYIPNMDWSVRACRGTYSLVGGVSVSINTIQHCLIRKSEQLIMSTRRTGKEVISRLPSLLILINLGTNWNLQLFVIWMPVESYICAIKFLNQSAKFYIWLS